MSQIRLSKALSLFDANDFVDVQRCSYFRDGMYMPPSTYVEHMRVHALRNSDSDILKKIDNTVLRIDFSPTIVIYVRRENEVSGSTSTLKDDDVIHMTIK